MVRLIGGDKVRVELKTGKVISLKRSIAQSLQAKGLVTRMVE